MRCSDAATAPPVAPRSSTQRNASRAAARLPDRLCVRRIGPVRLDERRAELRRNQPHVITQAAQHPPPAMGRTTGLHRHHAWRPAGKEGTHLRSRQRPALQLTGLRLDLMHLKNPLCQIQAVSRTVHGGSPVPRVVARHFHSGTLMPFGLQGVRLLRLPTHRTLPLRSEEGGVHLI